MADDNVSAGITLARGSSSALSDHSPRKRADWRFLLPAPSNDRFENFLLFGESRHYGDSLVQTQVAQRIAYDIPSQKSIDAAAILDGAQVRLDQVAGCLVDGAPIFFEFTNPLRFGVKIGIKGIRSWLKTQGFSLTGVYWVLPGFRDAKRYISLELPNSVTWYLNTFYIAGSPVDRLLEIGLRMFVRHHSEHLLPFVKSIAITALKLPTGCSEPAVMSTIPEVRGKNIRTILLTSGQDESSRLVILPFVDSQTDPIAAVKIATHSEFNSMTNAEQATLAVLRDSLSGPLHNTVPEPRSVDFSGRNIVAVQSYMSGQSLWVSSGRWQLTQARAKKDLALAAQWLTCFHRQVQMGSILWDQAAVSSWLEPRLDEYAALFPLSPLEERLWRNVRERARTLQSKSLPRVWQHNDFGLWNLYRKGENLSVIDWESSSPGLPLCDLVYLVTHWTFIVRRYHSPADELRGISELWLEQSPRAKHARFAHQVIAEYLRALEIDTGFLPLLLVYTWVDRAIDRVHRQQRLKNPDYDNRLENRFVSYLGVLASGADGLFDGACPSA